MFKWSILCFHEHMLVRKRKCVFLTVKTIIIIIEGLSEVESPLVMNQSTTTSTSIDWNCLFPIGYQAPYPGQWPSSVSPGQQNYSDHSTAVNHSQSITSQAMDNSFGSVPMNTSLKRSPLADEHGKIKKKQDHNYCYLGNINTVL